jgi:hypothetical protein
MAISTEVMIPPFSELPKPGLSGTLACRAFQEVACLVETMGINVINDGIFGVPNAIHPQSGN